MSDQILECFWDKVEVQPNGCWNWSGVQDNHGYGIFSILSKSMKAHRFTYEINKGKIPNGLELDHLCRNTSCVNPEHLEAVTHKENIMRGSGIGAKNATKIYCPKGHELKEPNLVKWYLIRGWRKCRICDNKRSRIAMQQKRRSG